VFVFLVNYSETRVKLVPIVAELGKNQLKLFFPTVNPCWRARGSVVG
jgi:hypothetical protein